METTARLRSDLLRYRQLVRLICPRCTVEFYRPPNEARKGAKYCGRACRNAANRERMTGAQNHNWGGVMECRQCRKPLKDRHSRRIFCSRDCFNASGMMSDWIRTDENGVRYAGRIDANQPEIVDAIRKEGAGVLITSHLGGGFPDLIVGVPGNNILMEIKNPKGNYGKRGLNKLQKTFHETWPGAVYVVYTAEEAVAIVRKWLKNDHSEAA